MPRVTVQQINRIVTVIGQGNSAQTARELGVDPANITRSRTNLRLSEYMCELIMTYMNREYPNTKFEFRHITCSTSEFNQLFASYSELFNRLNEVLNPISQYNDNSSQQLSFSNFDKLSLLVGSYMSLYVCTNPKDKNDTMITVDRFLFDADSTARIVRTTQFDTLTGDKKYHGDITLKDDTLEFYVDFGDRRNPRCVYMADMPKSTHINGFVALCTDITTDYRKSTARAHLFIKIHHDTLDWSKFDKTYLSSSPLHKEANKVLADAIVMNSGRYEILLNKQIVVEKDSPIIEAILALSNAG